LENASKIQASSLERAARIARVRHPNLVRMLPLPGGAGFTPVFKADTPPTLAAGLAVVPLEQLVGYLMDVLAALESLHEDREAGRGFVHGEVCPQHVFIIDGIARLVPVVRRHWIAVTNPVTSSYAAPELLLDEAPDHRADLFSVGAMLWEAMTGAPPFSDRSPSGLRHQLELRPSELSEPAGTARDAQLGAIARRALSAPVLRYQNATDFSNALGKALEQRGDSTPRYPALDEEAAAPPPPPLQRSVTPFATFISQEPDGAAETAADSTSPVAAPLPSPDVRPSTDARLPARILQRLPWVAAGLTVALIGVLGSSRLSSSQTASSNPESQSSESPVVAPPATAAPASHAPSAEPALCAATCASAAAPSPSANEPRLPSRGQSAPKRTPPLPRVRANDYGI
jgi:serine/threonine protein kinase